VVTAMDTTNIGLKSALGIFDEVKELLGKV